MIRNKGILSRFADIMKSNMNALIDKFEDPEKMIDQTMNNLRKDLASVKAETANVMGAEKVAKRDVEECDKEIIEMRTYAEKAVRCGNDDDAKRFLQQKAKLEVTRESLLTAYEMAHDNAVKIRAMHDKLVSDMEVLELRRRTIKGITAVSRAQKSINKASIKVAGTSSGFSTFDRMEDKAYKNLYIAQSETELLDMNSSDTIRGLSEKYDKIMDADILDELNQIKNEVNVTEVATI